MLPAKLARRALLSLLALVLAACSHQWERPGSTTAESNVAWGRCEAEGMLRYPPRPETRVTPAYWMDREVCTDHGGDRRRRECRTEREHLPGTSQTEDVNAAARTETTELCMRQNGWRQVQH